MAEHAPGQDEAGYRAFVASWRVDNFPFCPIGLRLLYAVKQRDPSLYELGRQNHFAEFDDPVFLASPELQALAQHRAGCEDCNSC